MVLGSLNSTKPWGELLTDLKAELKRWGVQDYILPTHDESRRQGYVELSLAVRGNWAAPRCSRFTHEVNGTAKNLSALVQVIRANRLADQRGIGSMFAEVAKLLALPDPDNPYTVIGAASGMSVDKLRAAYRDALKRAHPDHGGTADALIKVRAAGQTLGIAG